MRFWSTQDIEEDDLPSDENSQLSAQISAPPTKVSRSASIQKSRVPSPAIKETPPEPVIFRVYLNSCFDKDIPSNSIERQTYCYEQDAPVLPINELRQKQIQKASVFALECAQAAFLKSVKATSYRNKKHIRLY